MTNLILTVTVIPLVTVTSLYLAYLGANVIVEAGYSHDGSHATTLAAPPALIYLERVQGPSCVMTSCHMNCWVQP